MTWTKPPSEFATAVANNTSETARRAALKMLRAMVTVSPRRDGIFQGAWVVGISSKNTFKPEKDSTPIPQDVAIENGSVIIDTHKRFATIFISNNLPYAQRMNEGWSQQVPINYVQIELQKIASEI